MSEAARLRYRSNNGYSAPMVVRAPYGGGVHGALYHSQSVEAFFTHVPGLKVVDPVDAVRRKGLLRAASATTTRSSSSSTRRCTGRVRGDVPDGEYTVPLGKAQITRPGTQVTVIAYGLMAHYALEAADRVADEGISVEVVDLRTLRPLDKETVLDSVRKTGKCLIVYEDNRFGGYGAEVAAIVAEEAFDYLDGPVTRIAGPDVPGVPYNHVLEDWFMVTRRRSPTGSASSRRTDGRPRIAVEARLRAIVDPYRDRLVADRSTASRSYAGRAGKAHDWFAFVKPGAAYVSYTYAGLHLARAARRHLARAPEAASGQPDGFSFSAVDEACSPSWRPRRAGVPALSRGGAATDRRVAAGADQGGHDRLRGRSARLRG